MSRVIHVSVRCCLIPLVLLVVSQERSLWAQGGGGGAKQGTVSSVTATGGLTATPNPITTTGTISISTGGVTNSMLAGGITNAKLENSSVTVTAGTGLSGGGSVSLGGATTLNNTGVLSFNGRTGNVAPTGSDYSFSLITGTATTSQLPATTAYTNVANAFTANQSIAGSLSITGGGSLSVAGGNITLPDTTAATSGVLNLDGVQFLHGFGGPSSTFVGRGAGNFTMDTGIQGGSFNTGVGTGSLASATAGYANAALGYETLLDNTTGAWNAALGTQALLNNQTGSYNTASGSGALFVNTNGQRNTASGAFALDQNTSGGYNIALGYHAGHNVVTGSHNIHIENEGLEENGVIRIGTNGTHTAAFIAGISGVPIAGAGVVVDANGQLGVTVSSRRFKNDIQDMDNATAKLLRLRPVTFRYSQGHNDGAQPLQYGLIAEEVAEVYPEMVQNTPDGQPNAVLYQFLAPMLLNEFQKQHHQIEAQQELIESLKGKLTQLVSQSQQLQAAVAQLKAQKDRGQK